MLSLTTSTNKAAAPTAPRIAISQGTRPEGGHASRTDPVRRNVRTTSGEIQRDVRGHGEPEAWTERWIRVSDRDVVEQSDGGGGRDGEGQARTD